MQPRTLRVFWSITPTLSGVMLVQSQKSKNWWLTQSGVVFSVQSVLSPHQFSVTGFHSVVLQRWFSLYYSIQTTTTIPTYTPPYIYWYRMQCMCTVYPNTLLRMHIHTDTHANTFKLLCMHDTCGLCQLCLHQGVLCRLSTFISFCVEMNVTVRDACVTPLRNFW